MDSLRQSQDEADRRIRERELELARLQTEETTFKQLESNLTRDLLKRNLSTAAIFAKLVNSVIDEVVASVDKMTDDLNGKR